jgi:two-component system LytT family response regulator
MVGRPTAQLAALKERRIDVLFLDIQMPGRGGLEVIEQVGEAHLPVTVFVTAHNQYAVKAFEFARWTTLPNR